MILLHTEIAARELDSKLLLAVIAARHGYPAIVSDLSSLNWGIRAGLFKGAVFHTKSVTPSPEKVARHDWLAQCGISITSQDEEGNLINYGYSEFADARFSARSVSQVAAIFTWGQEDFDYLTEQFPAQKAQFHLTGSPRADMWSRRFNSYWEVSNPRPSRPYVLVSSNMGLPQRAFKDGIRLEKEGGHFLGNPGMFENRFRQQAERHLILLEFIKAVKHLGENAHGYDVVLRPHPTDDFEAWEIFVGDVENVKVISAGSMSEWLPHAFAVVHNGCTTALEATITGVPILTYAPPHRQFGGPLANDLGKKLTSIGGLQDAVEASFLSSKGSVNPGNSGIPAAVSRKIHVDERELAAERIVAVWTSMIAAKKTQWFQRKMFVGIVRGATHLRHLKAKMKSILTGVRAVNTTGNKFPPQDFKVIRRKVESLAALLGFGGTIEVIRVNDRCFIVQKVN